MSSLPGTLPPPPRRVRGILSHANGGWFARLFTLPHTLVGVGATCYWIFLWCWAWFGADLPAVITSTEVQQSRKGGTTYLVRYEFKVDREIKDRSSAVSLDDYNRYQVQGDSKPRVTVRHLSFWLFENTELKNKVRLWNPPGFFTLWIAFWDAVVGAAFYMLWIKPIRVRLLYKYGETLPGSIVGKRTKSGKSTTYFVAYVFNHPYTGEQVKGEVEVPNVADYDRVRINQPVTVLYSPRKVKRNTVYELGGYSIKDLPVDRQLSSVDV